MNPFRRLCMWFVWNIPLGRLAPHVLHLALNGKSKMRRGGSHDTRLHRRAALPCFTYMRRVFVEEAMTHEAKFTVYFIVLLPVGIFVFLTVCAVLLKWSNFLERWVVQ